MWYVNEEVLLFVNGTKDTKVNNVQTLYTPDNILMFDTNNIKGRKNKNNTLHLDLHRQSLLVVSQDVEVLHAKLFIQVFHTLSTSHQLWTFKVHKYENHLQPLIRFKSSVAFLQSFTR